MRENFTIERFVIDFSEIIGDFESSPLKGSVAPETFRKIYTLYKTYFEDSITPLLSASDCSIMQTRLKDNLLDNHAFRVASMIVGYMHIVESRSLLKSVKGEFYFFNFHIIGSKATSRFVQKIKIANIIEFYDTVKYLEKQIVKHNMIEIEEFTLTAMSCDDFTRLDDEEFILTVRKW